MNAKFVYFIYLRFFPTSSDGSLFENWEERVLTVLHENGFTKDLRYVRKFCNRFSSLHFPQSWTPEKNHPFESLKKTKECYDAIEPATNQVAPKLTEEKNSDDHNVFLEYYKDTLMDTIKVNQYAWPFLDPVDLSIYTVSLILYCKFKY